jgi:hypothetical protein
MGRLPAEPPFHQAIDAKSAQVCHFAMKSPQLLTLFTKPLPRLGKVDRNWAN